MNSTFQIPPKAGSNRLFALDGIRAFSILFVLATHMLPLGPKRLDLNEMTGRVGMALFFTLSGFLIMVQLETRHSIPAFFIRRLSRIAPLAWVWSTLMLGLFSASWASDLPSHLLFYLNYAVTHITPDTAHFWSLCVEVHFYIFAGVLMLVTRSRGSIFIPFVFMALVLLRLFVAPLGTINTHLRVDEILGGAILALIWLGRFGDRPKELLQAIPLWPLILLLLLASHAVGGFFNAFRSTIATCLVGHILFVSQKGGFQWLGHRLLRYVAETSYALYIVHPATMHGWLGSGSTLVKYAKRSVSFALTFGLAHLSTFYLEHPATAYGRKIALKFERKSLSNPSGCAIQ